MRAHIASVVTSIALVVILVAPALAAPGAKLAPDDIQTTFFNGQPFVAATTSNVKFKMTFSADGKMKREPASGNGAKANCFTIVSAGESKWSVLKGSTIMATWSK